MVASVKVGSPKLEGAGAPRAGSGARWTTGHGARGRTGLTRSLGGAGPRCGAPGEAHSRGLPHRPAAPPQPGPVLVVYRQRRTICKHTCTSLKDVWAIPPPAPASLETLRTRAFPGVTQKRQKGNRVAQQAGISTSHDPGRGNPRGQVEDESSC